MEEIQGSSFRKEFQLELEGIRPKTSGCSEQLTEENSLSFNTEHMMNVHHKDFTSERVNVQGHLNNLSQLLDQMESTFHTLQSETGALSAGTRNLYFQKKAQMETVAEMLLSVGLHNLVDKSFSEQVAYLLEERARLLRKVNGMQSMNQQMRNVKDEMEHMRTALQQEEKKADCQQETLQSYVDEVSILTQELLCQKENNIQLQKHIVDLEQRAAKERRKLLENLKNTQKLLITTQEDLLCQRQENSELHSRTEQLEQEHLKVAAELKVTLSKLEQLERSDKNTTAELQISEQRNKELEHQLKKLSADLQNEKAVNLQSQQQEFASIRTKIDALKNELARHKTQWEDRSFILRRNHKELTSIRAQIPAMYEQIKDLKQIMATTIEPKLKKTQKPRVPLLENKKTAQKQSTLNVQEAKRICQGIIETLQKKLSSKQQENESLRTELIQTLDTLGTQTSIFNKKKISYKEKLCKAKDIYLKETGWRDDKIKELERELRFLTLRLEKEKEMVKNMMDENEKLLHANISLEMRFCDKQ